MGGVQLLQRVSGACTPLHFNFLSSIHASKLICLAFSINSSPIQFVHLPFGPC